MKTENLVYYKNENDLHFLFYDKAQVCYKEKCVYFFSCVTGTVGSYNNYEVELFYTENELLNYEVEKINGLHSFIPEKQLVNIQINLGNIRNKLPHLQLNELYSQLISTISFACRTSGMGMPLKDSLDAYKISEDLFTANLQLVYHPNLNNILFELLTLMGICSFSEVKIS
jgi:hypothetical protein